MWEGLITEFLGGAPTSITSLFRSLVRFLSQVWDNLSQAKKSTVLHATLNRVKCLSPPPYEMSVPPV